MELNSLLFPKPKSSYTVESLHEDLFYVPTKGDLRKYLYKFEKSNTKDGKFCKINKSCSSTSAPKPCFSSTIQVKPNKKYGVKNDWDQQNIEKIVSLDEKIK